MSDLPKQASVVIVGAGIVGNCLAVHLARLGWKDIVLVDKGPLPNPGGSTGHASNFIFPVDHSKEMTLLTLRASASTRSWASRPRAAESRSPAAGAARGAQAADGVGQGMGHEPSALISPPR